MNNLGLIAGGYDAGSLTTSYVLMPEETDLDGVPDNWLRDEDGDRINGLLKLITPVRRYSPQFPDPMCQPPALPEVADSNSSESRSKGARFTRVHSRVPRAPCPITFG